MANLVQIAEELEYMPKDQLAQMTQDPNSTYPQFLVLSEIQRRTQLERAYQAQAEGMGPQTTVAEETVAEFMGSQGLQGMAEQPMPQDMQPPMQPPMQQPMAESPMQMAANGGRTGFMQGGISTRGSLLNTMGIEHTGMTEQEMGNLIGGINREEEQAPRSFGLMDREIVPEISEPETDMMADGGRTGFFAMGSTSFGGSPFGGLPDDISNLPDSNAEQPNISEDQQKELLNELDVSGEQKNFFEKRYTKKDGSIDYGTAALDGFDVLTTAALAIPIAGLGIKAGGAAISGVARAGLAAYRAGKFKPVIEGIKKGLKATYTKPNPAIDDAISYGARSVNPRMINAQTGATVSERVFSPLRTMFGLGAAGKVTNATVNALRNEEDDEIDNTTTPITTGPTRGPTTDTTTDTKKSGLFSNISQDQGLTIAQLGGVLMGAKNMSELGTGIAGVAGQAQDRRSSAGLQGAQQAYYEGQVRKIDDEIANMEPKQLIQLMEVLKDNMKVINEGAGDVSEIPRIQNAINSALEKYMELTGQEMPLTEEERLKKALKESLVP